MKKSHIYNKVRRWTKKVVLIICPLSFSAALTSCNDFLDILPMNQVVLENYWTEKADVTNVMNSCYEAIENSNCLTRFAVWGELRSDNMRQGGGAIPNEINEILKENILPSNPMANWASVYECINRCNIVCHYAPEVQAIDPNYTEAEMRANLAEAITLRSLCYFYLIRTFRDVPYTNEPSIDDTQNYVIAASSFESILDTLINDLKSVEKDAVRRYYTDDSPSAYINSSKVTRTTIHALLADLYLWKGDWENCIRYCDLILDFKRQQYEDMLEREGNIYDMALFDDIPLILDMPAGTTQCGNAYNEIFGQGNSFESLFELHFRSNQGLQNSWVSNYYGNDVNTIGYLAAPAFLCDGVPSSENNIFTNTDGRFYSNVEPTNSRYAIAKYSRQTVYFTTKNVSIKTMADIKLSATRRSVASANWIIYRLTEIMLIKAEALIERGTGDDFEKAFRLIDLVNRRGNNITAEAAKGTLDKSKYIDSKAMMENLLLEERQRELLFEGKRWFDLVRTSRRDGNTNRLVTLATRKYQEGVNAIKIKLADPNIIYMPYSKNELKVNPLLKQNSAYANGEDSELLK